MTKSCYMKCMKNLKIKNKKKIDNQLQKCTKNEKKFLEEEKKLVGIINPLLFIMLHSCFLCNWNIPLTKS